MKHYAKQNIKRIGTTDQSCFFEIRIVRCNNSQICQLMHVILFPGCSTYCPRHNYLLGVKLMKKKS